MSPEPTRPLIEPYNVQGEVTIHEAIKKHDDLEQHPDTPRIVLLDFDFNSVEDMMTGAKFAT